MGNKLLLGAQAALFATAVGLTLPGCFTVGDDDSGSAGDAGQSGEPSKGGSGGSSSGSAGKGGSAGTGGTDVPANGGTSGTASCVPTGSTCAETSECCSAAESNGVCVESTCADGCQDDNDCDTGCCAALQSGGHACGPADVCGPPVCANNGQACTVNGDCCSYNEGAGYCISDLNTCSAACTSNDECQSGCCVSLDGVDEGACAPPEYCR